MPLEISCPTCGTRLSVKESSIGLSVRCPKCQHTMVVPDNRPPALPVLPLPVGDLDEPRQRPRRDDYDDEPRPRRDDDYDDRPRRARRDEEYDDDRPRRARRDQYGDRDARRRPEEGGGAAVAALVLGIVGLVTLCIPYVNFLGLLCSILAIILGAVGRNSRSGGMAIAGLVLGILVVVLWAVLVILVLAIGIHLTDPYHWS